MSTDTNVKQVVINKLTQAQYDAAMKNATELYLTPDNNASSIYFATSTTAAATAQKEISIPEITTLNTGQVIVVQPTITSTVANSTIKLNSFAPAAMRYNNAAITTSTDSYVWNANFPSIFVYDGTYWRFVAHGVDYNTEYTINYMIDAGVAKAGGTSASDYAVSRYSLVMQKPDQTWEKITSMSATYDTGTSKSVNTNGFLPNFIKYYNSTTAVAGLGTMASNTLRSQTGSVDLRYSTNCGDTTTWAQGEYIYLVGTISNGLFYLDTTTWWTNALPSTNDGKYYIRVGYVITAASYSCSLLLDHPIFYHDGTSIKQYNEAIASSVTADGTTIVNNSGTISTVAIKEQRANTAIKEWVGTKSQYDGITTKDSNTKYVITDDNDVGLVIDSALSTTSANAVENRVVTNAIQNMATAKTRFTGEIIESSVPLSDAGLHLLDGSVIVGNGSYSAFVTYMAGKVSTNPEIFTTEANWQQSITDYGVCSKFVYSSGDNSIRLPQILSSDRYLIDSYQSGTSWYRIYSDGWCEQGGSVDISGNVTSQTTNLYKQYGDTNYEIFLSSSDVSGTTVNAVEMAWGFKTTNTFQWGRNEGYSTANTVNWTTKGFMDVSTLKLDHLYQYIVIANVTNTQVEIDINEVMADVNNKVDKDDLGEIQCIVESYSNGTEWYRIYSDGWCEQGGFVTGTSNYRKVITFLKEFNNANYSVYFGAQYTSNATATPLVETSTKTSTGFTMISADNANYSTYWEAKGYIL